MSLTRTVSPTGWASVGVWLVAAFVAWASASTLAVRSSSGAIVALIFSSGLTVVLCRVAAIRWPALPPTILVAVAIALIVADPEAMFETGPLQGPFGYANATAAFMVQATVGAFMLILAARAPVARMGGAIAVAVFSAIVLITRSWTAAILLPSVIGISLVLERVRGARWSIAATGGLFAVTLALTLTIGAGVLDGDEALGRLAGDAISQRAVLWDEALALMVEHPVFGVGPGRFAVLSPTASGDSDLRWAHNEFLQTGAEIGVVGFVLCVSLFLWGFVALWLGAPGILAALASAALALLGMHASVDYVLHFPAVALAGATMLGTGLGAPRIDPERRVGDSQAGWEHT
jgi:O-antigen ligase